MTVRRSAHDLRPAACFGLLLVGFVLIVAFAGADAQPPHSPAGQTTTAAADAPFGTERAPERAGADTSTPGGHPGSAPSGRRNGQLRHLTGTVRDERGRAVPAYRIELFGAAGAEPGPSIAVHDPAGRFDAGLRIAPPWIVAVTAPGFEPCRAGPFEPGPDAAIRLVRPALVFGRVIGPDGSTIPDIEVECADGDANVVARAISGSDGDYELHPGRPGIVELRVFGRPAAPPLACRTGSPLRFDVQAPEAIEVRLRLVDDGDTPVQGASIALSVGRTERSLVTGADGSATLRFVPRGDHRLCVTAPGYTTVRRRVDTRDPAMRTFDVAITLRRVPG